MKKNYVISLGSFIMSTSFFLSYSMDECVLKQARTIEESIKQRIDRNELNTYCAIRKAVIRSIDVIPRRWFRNAVRESFLLSFKGAIPVVTLHHEANVQLLRCCNAGDQEPALYTVIDGGILAVWKRNHEQQWYRTHTINTHGLSSVQCMEALTDGRLAVGVYEGHAKGDSKLLLYNQVCRNRSFSWEIEREISIPGIIKVHAFTMDESRCAISTEVNGARRDLITILGKDYNQNEYITLASRALNYPVNQLRWNGWDQLEMNDGLRAKKLENVQGYWRFVSSAGEAGAARPADIKWSASIEGSNVIVHYSTPLLSSVVHYLLQQAQRDKNFPPLKSPVGASQGIKKSVINAGLVAASPLSPIRQRSIAHGKPDDGPDKDGLMEKMVSSLLGDED